QAWNLQISLGTAYGERADHNQLANIPLFASRGLILDRMGRVLAGNATLPGADYPVRVYGDWSGISAVVGYAKPPGRDASGNYFRLTSAGQTGIEVAFA